MSALWSRPRIGAATAIAAVAAFGCAQLRSADPQCYRLGESGSHWDVSQGDRVFDDLRPRYPEFFEIILDTSKARVPDLRALRDDLEHRPVDRRNFDALNAVAIGYYETNFRAESDRGDGLLYLALSQRSAKLLAVPWRAYAETDDPALRGAILDFFRDAGSGHKLNTTATAPRLARIVRSLEKKEADPERSARIKTLSQDLETKARALGLMLEP